MPEIRVLEDDRKTLNGFSTLVNSVLEG